MNPGLDAVAPAPCLDRSELGGACGLALPKISRREVECWLASGNGRCMGGWPDAPDVTSQMAGFLHEFEHGENHNSALEAAIDASTAAYSADTV